MKIIHSYSEWQSVQVDLSGSSVGLVPTMGALHEGHLSLVRRSLAENDHTVVSIFLNPTQFNNQADLAAYPSSFEADCVLLEAAGVEFLFAPDYRTIYPDDYRYRLSETTLSATLCGATRIGHFEGVLTVVMKLLNIIRPQRAYFGEKDYQQYLLIRGMVEAFFLPVEVVPCPLVREANGLALSSRNRRLSADALKRAPAFYQALSAPLPVAAIRERLDADGFAIDYLEQSGDRLFGAVFLEGVRLIDNVQR